MAEVLLAKVAGPFGFEKTLVLKRILPHLLDEPAFVEMFLAEARLVAQLNHPHIVQIFDFGEADGSYFVAMEYIDGPNLRTLVRRARELDTFLPSTLCAKMIAAAAEGLAYAHDFRDPVTQQPLGLIHRDISPDNILLSRQGAVKVADFGIAKVTGHGPQTQAGILKGKLPYMPPEQLRGQPLDRRADVYALGLVFYELLTAQKPFAVTAEEGMLNAILFEPFIPAQKRRPGLPEVIQQILDRALSKNRDERYPDCLALQADLEQFVLSRGEPLGALHIARLLGQMEADAAKTTTPVPSTAVALQAPVPQKQPPSVLPSQEEAETTPESPTLPATPLPFQHPQRAVPASPQLRVSTDHPGSSAEPSATNTSAATMRPRRRAHVALSTIAALLTVSGGGYLLWGGDTASPTQFSTSTPVLEVAPIEPPPEHRDQEHTPISQQAPAPLAFAADAGLPEPAPLPVPDNTPVPPPTPRPATVRAKAPAPRPPRPTHAVPGKARIDFRVLPYATVFLDGKEIGTTPFAAIEISSGRHIVRLLNREFGGTETRDINVKPGEFFILKHNFSKN
uniref:serine/threonine protein kinase n=1 Tax=Hyalangium versicolor TaxID=2861190 RepID=UPI0035A067EE